MKQQDESDDDDVFMALALERVALRVLIERIYDIINQLILNTWKSHLLDLIKLDQDKYENTLLSLGNSSSSLAPIPFKDVLSDISFKMDRTIMLHKIVNMVSILVDDFPVVTTFLNTNPWTIAQRYIEIENYLTKKHHIISIELMAHIETVIKQSLHNIFNPSTSYDMLLHSGEVPTIDYDYTVRTLSINNRYRLNFELLSGIYELLRKQVHQELELLNKDLLNKLISVDVVPAKTPLVDIRLLLDKEAFKHHLVVVSSIVIEKVITSFYDLSTKYSSTDIYTIGSFYSGIRNDVTHKKQVLGHYYKVILDVT